MARGLMFVAGPASRDYYQRTLSETLFYTDAIAWSDDMYMTILSCATMSRGPMSRGRLRRSGQVAHESEHECTTRFIKETVTQVRAL